MAFQLSAGVNVSEIDLTTIVPSVATSIGAFAGPFAWGPAGEIITISDEIRLADTFGNPNSTNYEYWFSAANFLAYSNNLKIVRAVNTAAQTRNALANTAATLLIQNDDSWFNNYQNGSGNTYGEFAARYAGALGNSLKVSLADANTFSTWVYNNNFTSAPNTSTYVTNVGGGFDEVHAVVVDEDGKFTGTANTVLEVFAFMSKASDAKDDSGNSSYYKNVIETQSKYIHWMDHPTTATGTAWGSAANTSNFANLTSVVTRSLGNGADGTISTANVVTAYDYFDPAESVDISLVISGPANRAIADSLITMATTRKDCLVFLSPEKADVVNNAGSEVTDIS